jgi:hypothetical protein
MEIFVPSGEMPLFSEDLNDDTTEWESIWGDLDNDEGEIRNTSTVF